MTGINLPKSYVDAMQNGMTLTMPVEDGTEYYDVIVEHLGGTEYQCTAKTNFGDKPIDYPKIEDKPEDQTIHKWIADMKDYEIMAGHKIYYDIWNFEDNSTLNKKLLEAFENAKKIRRPMTPVEGSARWREDLNGMEIYVGNKWVQMSGVSK